MTDFPVSSTPISSKNVITRRSANFHPSVWGHHFLTHATEYQVINFNMERHQELKEEVRKMLMTAGENLSCQLDLIDQIQRLGVAYHFEGEIEVSLKHVFDDRHQLDKYVEENDVYTLALSFRLLRQQGYNISSAMFEKLKDNKGNFMEPITSDVRGMLSLYEATHMKVHGEDILEETLEFTTTYLNAIKAKLSGPLAAQVAHSLNQPIRKALPRLEARRYIPIYKDDNTCNQILLDFAKLDFNMLQKLHQRELIDICRWWKELNFAKKLPFARDRIVECYFLVLGVYFEPQYSFARNFLTKVFSFISTIDDIYDVYGTFEELLLFTDAVERWDLHALDQLPEYMRDCYRALLNAYSETEQELANHGISYRINYAKATMKRLVAAFMEEARWLHQGYVPTMDEYMKVALVTGAQLMIATNSFVGMRDELITKNTFEWVINDPPIVKASSVICRLMDDIVGHEFEQKRGHVASAVECYMKQYGATKQETYGILEKQVRDAWIDMNEEYICATTMMPMAPVVTRVLNLARVLNLLYQDKDGYTHSTTKTKNLITRILVDPLPI